MKNIAILIALWATILTVSSCKKDLDPIYEVNPVTVRTFGSEKTREKTAIEFISIAYSDIYGNSISQNILNKINTPYLGFGDKKAIEDLIVKNFLNSTNNALPSDQEMKANPELFVKTNFEKLMNRTPNEFEIWFLVEYINKNPNITTVEFYYSIMTSDEYRYY